MRTKMAGPEPARPAKPATPRGKRPERPAAPAGDAHQPKAIDPASIRSSVLVPITGNTPAGWASSQA